MCIADILMRELQFNLQAALWRFLGGLPKHNYHYPSPCRAKLRQRGQNSRPGMKRITHPNYPSPSGSSGDLAEDRASCDDDLKAALANPVAPSCLPNSSVCYVKTSLRFQRSHKSSGFAGCKPLRRRKVRKPPTSRAKTLHAESESLIILASKLCRLRPRVIATFVRFCWAPDQIRIDWSREFSTSSKLESRKEPQGASLTSAMGKAIRYIELSFRRPMVQSR